MRNIAALGSLVVAVLVTACGGGSDQLPPPAPPPPPPPPAAVAPPAPTQETPPPAPKESLADLQKSALKAAAEALNGHDAKKVAAAYADDALISVAGLNDVSGKDAIAANMQEWFDTFSKMKIGFSRAWTKDDVMVLEWVLAGTASGELFGVKGGDQPIGHLGLSVLFFDKDGHVKNEHRYGDLGTVMQQLNGKKDAKPAVPTIPEAPELIPATGAPAEATNVDVVKALQASLEKKSEADFMGKVADDVEYDGHLGHVKGKDQAKKFFATFTKAFPDAKFDVTGGWGIGDYAIVEYTLHGTQKGPVMGLAPTGRKVNVHAVDVMRIKDGKVQKAQTYANGLELMSQLGAFKVDAGPTPPAKPAAKPAAPASGAKSDAPKK